MATSIQSSPTSKPDRCEVCNVVTDGLCYDYARKTGKFRGWLCENCYKVIFLADEDPEYLNRLAAFAEKQKARRS